MEIFEKKIRKYSTKLIYINKNNHKIINIVPYLQAQLVVVDGVFVYQESYNFFAVKYLSVCL